MHNFKPGTLLEVEQVWFREDTGEPMTQHWYTLAEDGFGEMRDGLTYPRKAIEPGTIVMFIRILNSQHNTIVVLHEGELVGIYSTFVRKAQPLSQN